MVLTTRRPYPFYLDPLQYWLLKRCVFNAWLHYLNRMIDVWPWREHENMLV